MMKIVLVALACVSFAAGGLIGGYTESKPATDKIQALVDQFKVDVQGVVDEPMPEFTAVSYRMQEVNGVNYKVKVSVGNGNYVVLKIYRPFGGEAVLNGISKP